MKQDRWIRRRRADLLSATTPAERTARDLLERLGYEVVSQLPIKTPQKLFYADLAIPKLKTVIEIDGGYHSSQAQKRLDKNRSECIRRMGWHVLRLSNRDARNVSKIITKLRLVT